MKLQEEANRKGGCRRSEAEKVATVENVGKANPRHKRGKRGYRGKRAGEGVAKKKRKARRVSEGKRKFSLRGLPLSRKKMD